MEILSAEQIRAWDEYTMQHEPIASADLMERAAASCYSWLESNNYTGRSFAIYCGKGNNGGDGLALARMLSDAGCSVTVHILEFGFLGTDDFQINLARLHQTSAEVRFIQGVDNFHPVAPGDILVDALLGSGLNRRLEGVAAELVDHLNSSGNEIIAVDISSGLFVSRSSRGNTTIRATHTLSFQCYKPAFLMPENAESVGAVHILEIGLDSGYLQQFSREAELLDAGIVRAIYKPRSVFANKGNFGHALLVAGSYGKMGAAVLGARACLRSGVGLLSVHVPGCGYPILQTAIPEAMVFVDADERIHTAFEGDPSVYSAVGVGPGIGTEGRTVEFLRDLLGRSSKPMVLDADALNIIASSADLWERVPPYSILTPHPKEFERLFGPSGDDFARVEKAREQARQRQCIIVLKGHYTYIAMPGGKGYFNSTGNPGMAKGGSGDVLTGILTAMLSQGYSPGEAALLGVYLHGLAGDLAAATWSQESMLASDLVEHLGSAFQQLIKVG